MVIILEETIALPAYAKRVADGSLDNEHVYGAGNLMADAASRLKVEVLDELARAMGVDHRRVELLAAARAFIEKVLTRIGDIERRRTLKRPRHDPKEAGGEAYKHDVSP
eukprot:5987696-Prymnesium_polylepis.1